MVTEAAVSITDAAGRQVFGLTASMCDMLEKRGTPAMFGEYIVRISIDPPAPWWLNLPGAMLFAHVRNRVHLRYTDTRTRLRVRSILRKRRNPYDGGTTNPSTCTPADD